MQEENNTVSGAICLGGSKLISGTISVSGASLLHILGETGEYIRFDNKPYQITLHRRQNQTDD